MSKEQTFARVILLLLILCSVFAIAKIGDNISNCSAVNWKDNQCILQ